MCGRYYVDDETAREIERLVQNLDQRRGLGQTGDVRPSQTAAVLRRQEDQMRTDWMQWGFLRYDGKGLLINARAESALEKRSFRESILYRRCVIPARGFYEWNREKEKYCYERSDSPVLYMAGCFREFQDQERFVILTTRANPSVSPVHDRMPLILDREELEDWVLDDGAAEILLRKTPVLLESRAEYEQVRLF